MIRYYVEFAPVYEITGIYVYAYSEQHVRDIFKDYDLIDIIPNADQKEKQNGERS